MSVRAAPSQRVLCVPRHAVLVRQVTEFVVWVTCGAMLGTACQGCRDGVAEGGSGVPLLAGRVCHVTCGGDATQPRPSCSLCSYVLVCWMASAAMSHDVDAAWGRCRRGGALSGAERRCAGRGGHGGRPANHYVIILGQAARRTPALPRLTTYNSHCHISLEVSRTLIIYEKYI